MNFFLILLILLQTQYSLANSNTKSAEKNVNKKLSPKQEHLVNEKLVVESAEFVVNELRMLSESGIYKTLSISKILKAASQDGIFHHNIFLTLELASSYFQSGLKSETYEFILMTNHNDSSRTFAIDKFPEMDEDAIEEFWIQMVEDHRNKRKLLFEEWERESEFENNENKEDDNMSRLRSMKAIELRKMLNSDSSSEELKQEILLILDERWEALDKSENTIKNVIEKDEL